MDRPRPGRLLNLEDDIIRKAGFLSNQGGQHKGAKGPVQPLMLSVQNIKRSVLLTVSVGR